MDPLPLWEREWLQHLPDPVVRVVGPAVLDVDQLLAHAHGNGTGRAAADEEVAAHRAYFADRRDDGCRAAGEGFLQLAARGIRTPLVDGVGLLAHARAGIPGERNDGIAGD